MLRKQWGRTYSSSTSSYDVRNLCGRDLILEGPVLAALAAQPSGKAVRRSRQPPKDLLHPAASLQTGNFTTTFSRAAELCHFTVCRSPTIVGGHPLEFVTHTCHLLASAPEQFGRRKIQTPCHHTTTVNDDNIHFGHGASEI